MNIENLTILRDHLKTLPEQENVEVGFNMLMYKRKITPLIRDHSGHNCGTVACIAGHAVMLFDTDEDFAASRKTYVRAKDLLELDEDEANALFICPPKPLSSVTLPEAVRAIDNLIETQNYKGIWDGATFVT